MSASWLADKIEQWPTAKLVPSTMKPVALFEYQMLNSTKAGDIVFDPFSGSGTTLIACEKNARAARVIELDPKYADASIRRWEAFTGKDAVLESTGATFKSAEAVTRGSKENPADAGTAQAH